MPARASCKELKLFQLEGILIFLALNNISGAYFL